MDKYEVKTRITKSDKKENGNKYKYMQIYMHKWSPDGEVS